MSTFDDQQAAISDLLLRSAQGDQTAFATLYKTTSSKLFAVLMAKLRDYDLAVEILQQTYVTIWDKASLFDPERGQPVAWLIVIARNRAIDALRARARQPDFEPVSESLPDLQPNVEAEATSVLLRRTLDAAMSRLPENVAVALRMNTEEGLSSAEIAERLGIPVNTVKSRLRRGLARLRSDVPWERVSDAI